MRSVTSCLRVVLPETKSIGMVRSWVLKGAWVSQRVWAGSWAPSRTSMSPVGGCWAVIAAVLQQAGQGLPVMLGTVICGRTSGMETKR